MGALRKVVSRLGEGCGSLPRGCCLAAPSMREMKSYEEEGLQ